MRGVLGSKVLSGFSDVLPSAKGVLAVFVLLC